MLAVVVDGRYKEMALGSVHNVEKLNRTTLKLEGIKREFVPSICAYVDDEGKRITIDMAIHINSLERKGIK